MLVGGVADHLVHDDLEAQGMGLLDQEVEILKRAEERIDGHVVRHVIAHVGLRRLGERRKPDAIDTETGNVVEPVDDAWQVAHAIAIAVLKGSRIDLIDHSATPPITHRLNSPGAMRPTFRIRSEAIGFRARC